MTLANYTENQLKGMFEMLSIQTSPMTFSEKEMFAKLKEYFKPVKVRKTITTQLRKRYDTILNIERRYYKLEKQLYMFFGSKLVDMTEKADKLNNQVKTKERAFEEYIIKNNITEDEWCESGVEGDSCCSLEDYIN